MIALFLRKLALASGDLGDLTEGRRPARTGVEDWRDVAGSVQPELPALQDDPGATSLLSDGEYAEARRLYAARRVSYEKCLGPGNSDDGNGRTQRGASGRELGDLAEAERAAATGGAHLVDRSRPNHPYVARGIDALAEVVAARGDSAQR